MVMLALPKPSNPKMDTVARVILSASEGSRSLVSEHLPCAQHSKWAFSIPAR